MGSWKRLSFHVVALVHHLGTLATINSIDFLATKNPTIIQMEEFSLRYFSIWTFIAQVIFLALASLCDLGELKPELVKKFYSEKALRQHAHVKDFIFNSIVFPCTIMTVVGFWVIYQYDRELILPQVMELVVHPVINHALHSHIMVVLILELLWGGRKAPRDMQRQSLCLLALFTAIYYVVFFFTYYSTGRWIYKVFNIWGWTERSIFVFSSGLALYTLFFAGAHAQEFVHDSAIFKKRTGKFANFSQMKGTMQESTLDNAALKNGTEQKSEDFSQKEGTVQGVKKFYDGKSRPNPSDIGAWLRYNCQRLYDD